MRPTAWVSFLAVLLLAGGVCNGMSAHVRAARPQTTERLPWVIVGDWMTSDTSDEEVVQQALDKAQAKVNDYLHAQNPPIEWPIDRSYLQQKLWVNLEAEEPALKAQMKPAEDWKNLEKKTLLGHTVQVQTRELPVGKVVRAVILVNISDPVQREIEQQERVYQVKQRQDRATRRQSWLAPVLAGLVAVLAAVALYFRLEDATKGYYTTLLRAAAVAFVAVVGAGILVWLRTWHI